MDRFPVPTEIDVTLATAEGEPEALVVLIVSTPIGESHYFLSAEGAKYIGEALTRAATDAQNSGIVPIKNQLIIPGAG